MSMKLNQATMYALNRKLKANSLFFSVPLPSRTNYFTYNVFGSSVPQR